MCQEENERSKGYGSGDAVERTASDSDGVGRRAFLAAGAAAAGLAPDIARANRTPVVNDVQQTNQTLESPDGSVRVRFSVGGGRPRYAVQYEDRQVIRPSPLGFQFRDVPSMTDGFAISGVERNGADETWEPVWGTKSEIRDNYNELIVGLQESSSPGRSLTLVFRAYDDGVGFRYVLPEQENLGEFAITNETTGFRFAGDYTTWWIPDDYDNYEYLYEETPLSEISAREDAGQNVSPMDGVSTPVTMRTPNGIHLSVHEAALTDYAGMTLTRADGKPTAFESTLVPWPDGAKVKAETPHASPWRTIQLASEPGELVESDLVVNLNEPNALDDVSWIEPQKYMGIWWELHVGKTRWAPGPDVGATTENAKRYIDFASAHGIPSLLVEGWNVGWGTFEQWSNPPRTFNFTQSTKYYDLEEVVQYGKQQEPPVDIVMHNETGGGVGNYERQLDEAFDLYQELGIPAIKSGYVSEEGVDLEGERYHHHGQRMVNHYRLVTRKAAEHEIMLNVHEPIKPTGVRRTYPNLMTREGVSGLEYENFREEGNPPAHTVTIPFTRMLGGPLDYTPGIFDLTYPEYGDTRVHDTRARQLALYPMLFSGLQMVADLPENYDDLDVFEFIEEVPAAWDDTVVVDAEIGEYATIARRSGDVWYVGTGTNETPRTVSVSLDFLDDGEYVATTYTDGPEADLETNPTPVEIRRFRVTADDAVPASMVAGGGQAIRLVPIGQVEDDGQTPSLAAPDYEYDTLLVPYGVAAGDPFTVSVEVTNPGTVVGGTRLALYVDGETVASKFVRVGAGEETQFDFPLRLGDVGDHELGVGPVDEGPTLSKPTAVERPSAEFRMFDYSGFSVPEEAEVGTPVEIPVTVRNTGDELSVQVLRLTVDNEVVEAQSLTLEPGQKVDLTFDHAFEVAGTYEVALENLEAQQVTVE
ncbi:glycoside hydrolase family 97 protein [Haloprofundus salilacus]|uniref:glycoside hydrolase family 97 protein n=1 Tax=Haloprofundus salilacus TaxID=2876190 RepID=UPI001CC9D725|nr:glycoside hydrolase family 97 catalytic domain-containing protein [Haloprofundus salilacus]